MSDFIIALAFQHEGPIFRVRTIMRSGAISGRSAPLEPRPLQKLPRGYIRRPGEGIYEVPDMQGWVLAVGVASIVWLISQVGPGAREKEVSKFFVRDLLHRPALLALPDKNQPQFAVARFLPEGWTGSVCDPDLMVRKEEE